MLKEDIDSVRALFGSVLAVCDRFEKLGSLEQAEKDASEAAQRADLHAVEAADHFRITRKKLDEVNNELAKKWDDADAKARLIVAKAKVTAGEVSTSGDQQLRDVEAKIRDAQARCDTVTREVIVKTQELAVLEKKIADALEVSHR